MSREPVDGPSRCAQRVDVPEHLELEAVVESPRPASPRLDWRFAPHCWRLRDSECARLTGGEDGAEGQNRTGSVGPMIAAAKTRIAA